MGNQQKCIEYWSGVRVDQRSLGRKINRARKSKGMTSETLAGKCEVNPVFIRQIESGMRLPSMSVFIRICNALHVSSDFLLEDSLEKPDGDDKDEILVLLPNLTNRQLGVVREVVESKSATALFHG